MKGQTLYAGTGLCGLQGVPRGLPPLNTTFSEESKISQHICQNVFTYTDFYIETHRNIQNTYSKPKTRPKQSTSFSNIFFLISIFKIRHSQTSGFYDYFMGLLIGYLSRLPTARFRSGPRWERMFMRKYIFFSSGVAKNKTNRNIY